MSNKFTIVLDAGHGGTSLAEGSTPNNSVGANGLLEKDLTLKIARIAAAKLNSNDFRAFLTRDDDRNLSLAERARKSRETGADAFVSIHFNGHHDAAIDGTEVYISNASDAKDEALANELVKTVSLAASAPLRGVRKTDFTILKGDFHVSKTAACLVEMAYLTNPQQANKLLSPNYIEHLASAIAQSVANYANQFSYSKSFAEETGEKTIAEVTKEHADPKNFPIDLPEPGKGTDTIQINIPKNLKFTRWEVEVLADSPGAGYKVVEAPKTGAEGNHTITVDWWHLPYGKINFKLKAYASPDGSAAAPTVLYESKGWMEQARNQLQQGQGVNFAVRGEKAKLLYEALKKKTAEQNKNPAAKALDGGVVSVPVAIAAIIAGVAVVMIIACCVALGFFTLGAILKLAIDKGYDVKDTKYKAAVGEGEKRQEHELMFNLFKPK